MSVTVSNYLKKLRVFSSNHPTSANKNSQLIWAQMKILKIQRKSRLKRKFSRKVGKKTFIFFKWSKSTVWKKILPMKAFRENKLTDLLLIELFSRNFHTFQSKLKNASFRWVFLCNWLLILELLTSRLSMFLYNTLFWHEIWWTS